MRQPSYGEAITKVAFAFHALIEEYERRMSNAYGQSPYVFSELSGFYPSLLTDSRELFRETDATSGELEREHKRAVVRFAEDVTQALALVQRGMKVLSLGLDYNRYTRFSHLTPPVARVGGNLVIMTPDAPQSNAQACQDCVDFVVDAALRLQEAEQ